MSNWLANYKEGESTSVKVQLHENGQAHVVVVCYVFVVHVLHKLIIIKDIDNQSTWKINQSISNYGNWNSMSHET